MARTLSKAFLKIDIFRKLPRDLTEPTFCGAVISFLCAVFLVWLTCTEVLNYMQPATSSEISINSAEDAGDVFQINIAITMPRMPCDMIGLDL